MKSKERKKYLAKNTFLFALGNFGTKIISFFLVPLYTCFLTTSEFGSVDLISTISMVLAPVLILNISEALLRFPLDDDANNDEIMSIGVIFLLLGACVGLLLIPISRLFLSNFTFSIFLYLYVVSYAFFQVFASYLRGTEKILLYSVSNIINSLLIAIFNIIFLCFFHLNVYGYLLAYILAFFISGLFSFFCGKAIYVFKNFKFNPDIMKKMLKYSIVLIPNTFMWWIINSSDRVMITFFLGTAANGIYAISYKLPTLLTTFVTVFNQAWSYLAIKEEKSKDKQEFNNIVFNYLVCFLTITALLMILITKFFLKIYVESSFYEAWKYTPYLIIGFVFASIASFMATPYTVHKDSKGFLFSALTGAIINIILNFCLIPFIGIHGAAFATLISYFSVLIYRLIDTKKYLKINFFNLKNIIGYILIIVSAISMYFNYLVEIIICFVCIILCIIIYKDEYFSILKSFLKKLKIRRSQL